MVISRSRIFRRKRKVLSGSEDLLEIVGLGVAVESIRAVQYVA